jgi:hypothetical protein
MQGSKKLTRDPRIDKHSVPQYSITMSQQRSYTTVAEGGIPPAVPAILDLVGASEQSHPSSSIARDAKISTVPLSESPAVPLPLPPRMQAEIEASSRTLADWPTQMRGVPAFRPLDREVDYADKPMGQNNIEFVFLTFMFTGVRITGVSTARRPFKSQT